MKKMTSQSPEKKDSSFTIGMLIGAIFGGGALFFFGTKTGKKVKKQLQQELKDGSLDFESLKKDAQKRIQKLIKDTNVKELIAKTEKKKPKKTNKRKKTSKRYFSNTKSSS